MVNSIFLNIKRKKEDYLNKKNVIINMPKREEECYSRQGSEDQLQGGQTTVITAAVPSYTPAE